MSLNLSNAMLYCSLNRYTIVKTCFPSDFPYHLYTYMYERRLANFKENSYGLFFDRSPINCFLFSLDRRS